MTGMPDENAAVLEFAAILGEAIARAHLSGRKADTRNANAPGDDDRGGCVNVPLAKEDWNDDKCNTKTKIISRSN